MGFCWVARPDGFAPLAWPSLLPRHDRGAGAQQVQRPKRPGKYVVSLVPAIGFVMVALLAVAFAAVPLWRMSEKRGRLLLSGAIILFMLAIGGGTYFLVGRPHLAERSAQGINVRGDINGLVPYLIARVRAHPEDVRAWRYLASAYMAASDPRDAA